MSHGYVRGRDIRDGVVTAEKLAADVLSDLGLAPSGGAGRRFTINNKIVDSAAMAAAGIFHDDGSCMTWVEANVPAGEPVILWFAPANPLDLHVILGTGWATNSARDVTWEGNGGYNGDMLTMSGPVVLPTADVGTYPTLTIKDCALYQTYDITLGAYRYLTVTGGQMIADQSLKKIYLDDTGVYFYDCDLFAIQMAKSAASVTGLSFYAIDCRIRVRRSEILADDVHYGFSAINSSILVTASTAGATPKLVRTTAGNGMIASQATFINTDLVLYQDTTIVDCTLIDFGIAVSLITAQGLTVSPYISGTANMILTSANGTLNAIPGPYGIVCYRNNAAPPFYYQAGISINTVSYLLGPALTATNAVAPAFLTPVAVLANINEREVSAVIKATAAVTGGAGIALEVETALGSGVYREVAVHYVSIGAATARYNTVTARVPGGLRYQFRDLSTGAGVATIEPFNATNGATGYSYTDR